MTMELRPSYGGNFDVVVNRWVVAYVKPARNGQFEVRFTGIPYGDDEPIERTMFANKGEAANAAIQAFRQRVKDNG